MWISLEESTRLPANYVHALYLVFELTFYSEPKKFGPAFLRLLNFWSEIVSTFKPNLHKFATIIKIVEFCRF